MHRWCWCGSSASVLQKWYEIRTKFARNLYGICAKFVRTSYEFRTKFERNSYEVRTICMNLYHFCAEQTHSTHSTQHSNATTTQKNNTVRSSATVTNEEQQTDKAQQAASKTTIPTQPKSRHYTHIMTISSNKHKRQRVNNWKHRKSIVQHDSTTGTHPSNHPHPPIAHSTATQQQHRTTTPNNNTIRSSATVTIEEQQTDKAQQAAGKTKIPTQPKSKHYTHIMTVSSNKHKRQTVTNYKQHKSIAPHDSTKGTRNPRTTNACTYHPRKHTPCTHAHTNNNPCDQAHPHTHTQK